MGICFRLVDILDGLDVRLIRSGFNIAVPIGWWGRGEQTPRVVDDEGPFSDFGFDQTVGGQFIQRIDDCAPVHLELGSEYSLCRNSGTDGPLAVFDFLFDMIIDLLMKGVPDSFTGSQRVSLMFNFSLSCVANWLVLNRSNWLETNASTSYKVKVTLF